MLKYIPSGADETTPSRSEYFSWINNTNEGATEAVTLANLNFFAFLRETFSMQLDIYAFDAGAIDGKGFYGRTDSPRFRKQFPHGLALLAGIAAETGTRLGVWGGPDGFGTTDEEAQSRIDQMVELCRKFHFALFKFDSVCGTLRPEKEKYFIRMMQECRRYSPDLILLNHRLELQEGLPYATTFLWEGAESYIDVHCANPVTAPHHRAGALMRGVTPGLKRLVEDHGVCLSSCMDGWEDDLVLHAFNRSLILAPEIYGNPWLLRDDELPKLARYFNLHRKFREILISGMELPASQYGPHAISRGNAGQRLITLRNLDWKTCRYRLSADESIGLAPLEDLEIRLFHPYEFRFSPIRYGESIEIPVEPFRVVLIYVGSTLQDEPQITGIPYRVRKHNSEKIELELLLEPGSRQKLAIENAGKFAEIRLDGVSVEATVQHPAMLVGSPKTFLNMERCLRLPPFQIQPAVPVGLQRAGYEAAVFCADNNALEVRSLKRAGATRYPAVQAARDAFFSQPDFRGRGLWDRFLFDGDSATGFWPSHRFHRTPLSDACLRIDLGKSVFLGTLQLDCGDRRGLEPLLAEEAATLWISEDFHRWEKVEFITAPQMAIAVNRQTRYLKIPDCPGFLRSLSGTSPAGEALDTSAWRVSNLFSVHKQIHKLWTQEIDLGEFRDDSYLAVALNGTHGIEGAYVIFDCDGVLFGCPDRAPSFPANPWEFSPVECDSNYTYYFPLSQCRGYRKMQILVLGCDAEHLEFEPAAYLCCPPDSGFERRQLTLKWN